jgi:hypothetical protein
MSILFPFSSLLSIAPITKHAIESVLGFLRFYIVASCCGSPSNNISQVTVHTTQILIINA